MASPLLFLPAHSRHRDGCWGQAAPSWGSQAAVPHLLQTLLPAALPCPEQLPQFTAQMANVAQGKVPSTGAMS